MPHSVITKEATLRQTVSRYEQELGERYGGCYKIMVRRTDISNKAAYDITEIVAASYGTTSKAMRKQGRKHPEKDARMMAMYLIYHECYPTVHPAAIASMFGNRHRTTVLHAIRTVNDFLTVGDPMATYHYEQCRKAIGEMNEVRKLHENETV